MSAPLGATVFFSAGDLSGDLHAAALAEHLRANWPEVRLLGMGGPSMAAAGVDCVLDQRELAVGGIVELAKSAGRIASVWRRLGEAARRARPDLIVLVDSGGFNLRFASRVRRMLPGVPILYFVPPQAWAWRKRRARTMAARVDLVASILPFEGEVYERAGARVEFVGHPLVDRISAAGWDRERARRDLGLDEKAPRIALLPGSRRNEIERNLPLQLETARLLHAEHPELAFELAVAESLSDAEVDSATSQVSLPAACDVTLRRGRTLAQLAACDAAIVKPGTATLEATLLGTPMVVMGRGNALSAAIVGRWVDIPFWAMPNLLVGREVVPEFLQDDARPAAMARALESLVFGDGGPAQRAGLREAAAALGEGGAAERVAELASSLLRRPLPPASGPSAS